ncbi:BCCT family transporter [Lactobacillus sp. AN1001]
MIKQKIDWSMILIPTLLLGILSLIMQKFPNDSKITLQLIRELLGDKLSSYYVFIALLFFLSTIYLAFSKYGKVRLGDEEKPSYSNVKWGMMIFTSTMSADIIFYSLCEWMMYAKESFVQNRYGGVQEWAMTYSLFHWGPIAWSFYILLAIAFGYMLHVKGNKKQKFSEACRPLLGKKVDGILGKIIDLIAVIALIAGTATTFSLSMPLLSSAINDILGIPENKWLSIAMLGAIAVFYTCVSLFGMKGISKLATICFGMFLMLLIYFFIFGGAQTYIVESGIQSIGNLIQNFVGMSTELDPLRKYGFVQRWTTYYWSYWMVWCVATPFFIGTISKGRTIKNIILGAYSWGLAGTYLSFLILGNYGMFQQLVKKVGILKLVSADGDYTISIVKVFETMPGSKFGLLLLILTMIGLYSTVFDSITMVVSTYSYKELKVGNEPDRKMRLFWAVAFIILPITLILTDSSIYNLQSVSIIAAFPIGIVMLLIVFSFYKELRKNNGKQ